VPAVRDSFCFLAWLPFRQHMRPGAYIGVQCLRGVPSDSRESNEKRPLESTLTRNRNTWRGGRAPSALPNVPRALPPVPWAVGRRPSGAGRVANFPKCAFKTVDPPAAARGPVGPSRGARHRRREPPPGAENRGKSPPPERAATCAMFFTNSTEIKRYEFEKTRKWEER
jgi:hypothetical protein